MSRVPTFRPHPARIVPPATRTGTRVMGYAFRSPKIGQLAYVVLGKVAGKAPKADEP